jgi:hypothetical protein
MIIPSSRTTHVERAGATEKYTRGHGAALEVDDEAILIGYSKNAEKRMFLHT